ncbi:MAG: leucine-rich repeat protein [Paludibacteraceae bacterium]|nr:leucine-rich repeat protein [Paludibacteraceae bacterium]
MKKIGLLFVTFIFCINYVFATSGSGSCGENVKFIFDDDTDILTIYGKGAMATYNKESEVPWSSYGSEIKHLVIEEGVTEISDYAFFACLNIYEIKFPKSLEKIGKYSFSGCTGLTGIQLPTNLKTIDSYAFNACTALDSITIPASVESLGSYAFYKCNGLKRVDIKAQIKAIESYTFYECTVLKDIKLPTSLETLGGYVFAYSGLEAIVVPKGVTMIGNYAFYMCENLKDAKLPESLITFGVSNIVLNSYVFGGCKSLESIKIPSKVRLLGRYDFKDCTSLKNVDLGNLQQIGYHAFTNCTSLETIVIPNTVTTIDGSVFYGCTSLKNVKIPSSVTTLENSVFSNCISLENIELPGSLTSISSSLFNNCTGLKKVSIPNTITTIGGDAFRNCESLKRIDIPASVTKLENGVFYNCASLDTIVVNRADQPLTSAGANLFYKAPSSQTVYVPCGVVDGYKSSWTDYSDKVRSVGDMYKVVLSANVDTLGAVEDYATACENNVRVDSIYAKTIGEGMFLNWSDGETANPRRIVVDRNVNLTAIFVKNIASGKCGTDLTWTLDSRGILTISGTGAMSNYTAGKAPWQNYVSLIERVELAEGVTSIGNNAFSTCTNLKEVVIKNTAKVVTLGSGAIGTDDTKVYVPCGLLADYKKATNWKSITAKLASVGDYYKLTVKSNKESWGTVSASDAVCESNQVVRTLRAKVIADNIRFAEWSDGSTDSVHKVVVDADVDYVGTFAEIVVKGQCGDDLYWVLDSEGNLVISGTGPMYDFASSKDMVWANYTSQIMKVIVEEGATTIGNYGFYVCSNLEKVTLPSTLEKIGNYGFYGCSGFTSFDIPENVQTIGSYAFGGCTSLEGIVIPKSVETLGGYTFYKCNALKRVDIKAQIKAIESYTFYECTVLKDIKLPTSLETLGGYVFAYSGLEAIVVPKGVTMIGNYAFYMCENLKDAKLPESLITFGVSNIVLNSYVFGGCKSLESIKIPSKVRLLGRYDFKDCTSLKNVDLGNLQQIGYHAFTNCTSLETIVIPNTVTTIDGSVFYGCTSLKNVKIPNSVLSIGSSCFTNCTSLVNFSFPGSVTEVNSSMFSGCTSLKKVFIPNTVTSIGTDVFRNCTNMTQVIIPTSVTNIGSNAFYGCSSLDTLRNRRYDNPLTKLGSTFNGVSKDMKIYVPCSRLEDYPLEPIWKNYADVIFDEARLYDVRTYSNRKSLGYAAIVGRSCVDSVSVDTILATPKCGHFEMWNDSITDNPRAVRITSDTVLMAIFVPDTLTRGACGANTNWLLLCDSVLEIEGKGAMDDYSATNPAPWNEYLDFIATIIVKEGVTNVGDYTLPNDTALLNIELASTVTKIGKNAFSGCNKVEYVKLPKNMKTIGSSAFANCSSLKSMDIPAGVTSIAASTFKGCNAMEWVTMSNKVTAIGNDAFNGCNKLGNVELPTALKTIGNNAFANCDSLRHVVFSENVTSVGSNAFLNCSSLDTVECKRVLDPITKLGATAFDNCPDTLAIIVPCSRVDDYKAAANWKNYKKNFRMFAPAFSVSTSAPGVCSASEVKLAVVPDAGAPDVDVWTYTWNGGLLTGDTSMAVSTVSAGGDTFSVTVTNSIGCSKTKDITIVQYAIPEINIAAYSSDDDFTGKLTLNADTSVILCEGSKLKLVALPDTNSASITSWIWDDGAKSASETFFPGDTIKNKLTYRHHVIGTTVNGCLSDAYINVQISRIPQVTIRSNDVACYGSDIKLTAEGATRYEWLGSDNVTDSVYTTPATTLGNNTYTLYGYNADGCRGVASAIVKVNNLPKLNIEGDLQPCMDTYTELTGSGALSYQWTYDGITQDSLAISVLVKDQPTTVKLTGVDANNCQGEITRTITPIARPNFTINGDLEICANAVLQLEAVGDETARTYVWNGKDTTNIFNQIMPKAGSHDMSVTAILLNKPGCSSTEHFTVKVKELPQLSISGDTFPCENTTMTVTAYGAEKYVWSHQPDVTCVPTDAEGCTFTRNVKTASPFSVMLTGWMNGCRADSVFTFKVHPTPLVVIESDREDVCKGEKVTLKAIVPDSSSYSYDWGADGKEQIITSEITENKIFKVIVHDEFGCEGSDERMIESLEHPNLKVVVVSNGSETEVDDESPINVCSGEPLTLSARGAREFIWKDGTIVSDDINFELGNTTESRNIELTGALAGCVSNKTLSINVLNNPTVSIEADRTEVYVGETVKLTASSPDSVTYDWGSDGQNAVIEAVIREDRQFNVKVTDSNGCKAMASYTIKPKQQNIKYWDVYTYVEGEGEIKGGGSYAEGEEAVLLAMPGKGYHFVRWDNGVTTDTLRFVVNANEKIGAYFAIDSFKLETVATNGMVSGAGVYEYGWEVVLKATPDSGYIFDKWSTGEKEQEFVVRVVSDTTITAYFYKLDEVKVDALAENGIVRGTGYYKIGDKVSLYAVPNPGYHFLYWGDRTTVDSLNFTVTGDTLFFAYFGKDSVPGPAEEKIPVDVLVNYPLGQGAVEGAGTYSKGDTIVLIAKPEYGYHFDKWSNGVTTDTLTLIVEGDTTVSASFARDTFTIEAIAEMGGAVTGGGNYLYGDTAYLVAIPDTGYMFNGWSNGSTSDTIAVIAEKDQSFIAYFHRDGDIKVDVIAENGSAGGVGMYSKGDTVVLVAKPDTNYHFTHWGNGWTKDTLYLTVKSDTVIYAYFAIDSFKVESGCVNGGIAGVGVYPYGTTVALLAMPDSNYIFERWENGDTTATTRIVVTNDTVVTAYFYHKNSVYVDVLAEHGTVNGAGHYMVGDTISLSVQADWGYKFIGWDNGSTGDTLQLVVAGDSMVTALFRLDSFSIKAYCNNGAVLIAGPMTYVYGDTATLSVKPNEGYVLYNWSTGDTTSEIKVAILSDTVVVAYCYKEGFYPVSAVATNGIVNGVGDYEIGSVAHIEAEAVEGFHFVKWMHGDTVAAIDTTVNSPIVLYPVFEQDTFKVELEVVGNGTVSGEGYYAYGEVASIKATATDSSIFVRWSDGSTEAEREIKIKSDTVLTASFRDKQRVVISPEIDTTYGTIEGAGEYLEGDTIVLVIKPIDNDSVKFVGWSDGDTSTHKTVVVGVDDDVYPVFEKVNTDNTVIPNAFTPVTKDGINDHFMKGYEVRIFNRYQQLVHEGNDGWDGMYRGEFAEAGTYFYVVTMKDGRVHRGPVELVVFK